MASWSDGYFTDVQYTSHYYPELAPGFLAFACLRQGVRPPTLAAGSTYLELGCGQGFGLNLLAAANPGMSFWGVDFHPGQIDNAQRLARDAGLANITFEDLSFDQMLAQPEGRLPKFDIVALHGIYSWVSSENRAVIARLLDRVVKPGGMVYVSYNAMPGWAALVPLRRFVADYVGRAKGDAEVEVVNALRAARRMIEAKAGYFEDNPSLAARVDEALAQKPAYLVHEYLNGTSQPFFHADVAKEMAEARLWFAASANPADDLIHLAAPAPLQQGLRDTRDGAWRETLMDYASNKPFRRDIFIRGRNALGAGEHFALLGQTRLALLTQPDAVSLEFPIPIGQLKGGEAVYRPIIEALAQAPRAYDDIRRLPQLAGVVESALLQAVTLLIGSRQVHPLAPAQGDGQPARAFNQVLLRRMAFDEVPSYLASPLTGAAARVEFADLVAMRALSDGREDAERVAREAWPGMSRTGRRLLRKGEVLTDQAGNEAELADRIRAFKTARLPLYQGLGVI